MADEVWGKGDGQVEERRSGHRKLEECIFDDRVYDNAENWSELLSSSQKAGRTGKADTRKRNQPETTTPVPARPHSQTVHRNTRQTLFSPAPLHWQNRFLFVTSNLSRQHTGRASITLILDPGLKVTDQRSMFRLGFASVPKNCSNGLSPLNPGFGPELRIGMLPFQEIGTWDFHIFRTVFIACHISKSRS